MAKKKYSGLVYALAIAVSCATPYTAAAEPDAATRTAAETAANTESVSVQNAPNESATTETQVPVQADAAADNATTVGEDNAKNASVSGSNSVWWAREDPAESEADVTSTDATGKADKEKKQGRTAAKAKNDKNSVWWAREEETPPPAPQEEAANVGDNVPDGEEKTAAVESKAPTVPPKDPHMKENSVPADDAAEWSKTRPQEEIINAGMQKYEGRTVVDIEFEGASEKTFPTAKAALSMRIGDTFSVKGLERDREAVFNTGYFYDLYPEFTEVPEGVILTYHVLQNPILKEVIISGNTVEPTDKLKRLLPMRTGELLNSVALHEGVEAINKAYRDDDYILAKITDMNIDRDGVLTLKINEGILEGYSVKGNTKTKDYVILREMRQKTGEPFNGKLAKRSVQRVYNLGFFEDVDVKMNPGVAPNAVIMELDVKEKRTGSFGLGAGYSSQDGIIGMVSLTDLNFRGTGDAVSVTYEISGNDTEAHGYSFDYRKPWLDKKETSGTLRLYNRTYRYSDYDTDGNLKEKYMRKYSGGEITLSRPVSEYSRNAITLRNRKDRYTKHISSGNMGDRSTDFWKSWRDNNFGTTRSVIFEHVTDTRDNIYDPTEGGRVSLSGEIGGFGGDFNFRKFTIEVQRFRKVGRSQVFAMKASYGIGSGEISEFNQYKVGGQNSLRGYRDDQFRGNRMFLATLEYRFPIASKVQGALFTDWGSAWDNGLTPHNVKGSVGVGLSLNTPLGPLRLDYGRGSNGGRVHFSVGGSF